MYHDVDSEKYPYDLKDNTYNVTENSTIEVPALNDFIKVKGSKPTNGTVTIDSKGKVTNAVMVVLNYNITCDSSTNCSVEGEQVNKKITNIELSDDAEIEEEDTHIFTATVTPGDADTSTLTWCSTSNTVISGATEQGRCETGEYEITACYRNTSCEVTGASGGNTTIKAKINNVSNSAVLTIYKIHSLIPISSNYTNEIGTVIESSHWEDNQPYKYGWLAFDGDSTSKWGSARYQNNTPQYLGFVFNEPVYIDSIDLLNVATGGGDKATMNDIIEISDNGTDWVKIADISAVKEESAEGVDIRNIQINRTTKAIRAYRQTNNSTYNWYFQIGEFIIYGY